MTITLTDGPGGRQLGQVLINSASGGLPPGVNPSRTLDVATGSIGSTLSPITQVVSNGGQTTTINTSQQLVVTATPTSILVNSAQVSVANEAVNIDQVNLDAEIDANITEKIQGGAIVLDITNPFGIAGDATIRIDYPEGTLLRTRPVSSAETSSVRLEYTGQELRSFLGRDGVTLTGTGTVSTVSPVTVTPAQEVQIKAKLDVTLRMGG